MLPTSRVWDVGTTLRPRWAVIDAVNVATTWTSPRHVGDPAARCANVDLCRARVLEPTGSPLLLLLLLWHLLTSNRNVVTVSIVTWRVSATSAWFETLTREINHKRDERTQRRSGTCPKQGMARLPLLHQNQGNSRNRAVGALDFLHGQIDHRGWRYRGGSRDRTLAPSHSSGSIFANIEAVTVKGVVATGLSAPSPSSGSVFTEVESDTVTGGIVGASAPSSSYGLILTTINMPS